MRIPTQEQAHAHTQEKKSKAGTKAVRAPLGFPSANAALWQLSGEQAPFCGFDILLTKFPRRQIWLTEACALQPC